ncbi:Retrovirus-related Pol polyprotein from transposon TNT 1-94 [Araneus ventricosus]|uniref:Retrovirus-related Pol polyprotein from transposon TNT 1-94 n=1 Tax=Araneus ventricosus TaxID=182803 RepID=A0A4Y2QP49_ARAVE|nr:Retrovirus-related Pol polyprotein from transposon TNT 1-94 [Araneus ventricosus]
MTSSDEQLIRFSFGTFQCARWRQVYVNRPERVNIKSKTEPAETSEDSKPRVLGKSETSEVASAKQVLSWREEYDLKLRKDRSYTLIYQSLGPEFKPLISQTTDGAEAWRILKKHFEPTTRARVIQLLDEFFDTIFETREALGLFLCRVKQGAERLRKVGHQLQPLYQGYQMIRSLPAEYQSIVQTIYRWTDAEFQPDKIEIELLLEENHLRLTRKDLVLSSIAFSNEMHQKEAGNYYKQDEKLKTRSSKVRRFKNKTSNVKNKQIGPCYFCKSYGHLIANCKHKAALSNPKTNESSNTEFKVKGAFSELESNLIETFPDSHEANSSDFGQNTSWVFDTAATAYFCSNKSLYYSFEPVSNMQMALAVGEKESPVEEKGIIHFLVKDKDGKFSDIILKDVLYNPNLRRNLLSGSKLEILSINFVGSKGKIHVYDKNWNELFYALRKNDLYFLKPSKYVTMSKVKDESVNLSANQVEKVNTSDLWHEPFCHINNDYVLNTSKNNSVKGLPKLFGLTEDCISYKLAKSRRVSFKSMGQIRSKRPLELLHMDLCGPLPVLSQGGNRYFFTIVDDFSRKVTVFPIRNKSDAFQTFIRFQKRAERFLNRKVISVRTDGGLEFCNQEFEKFLDKLGIRHEKTNPYSPEMNGVAERFNLTALDGVKALLKSSGMSENFWAEALLCFTYTWNRVCHKNKKTPFELYSGRKPSVSHLKKFGCVAYVGVPKQTRKKLDMHAKLGIMCRYAQTTKGYRILLLEDQRVIETINVRFDETKRGVELVPDSKGSRFTLFKDFPEDGDIFSLVYDDLINWSESPRVVESTSKPIVEMREITSLEQNVIPCKSIDWVRKAVPRSDGSRIDIYYGIEGTNVKLRSFNDVMGYCERNKIQCDKNLFNFSGKNTETGKVTDLLNLNEANLLEVRIPRTYKEAIKVPEASKWEDAMNRELKVMHERNVWEFVKPPKDAKTLGNRWVYTLKRNEQNEIVTYKARFVAQGFNQIKGESYDEVFSPVVNFSIIRLFFTVFVCLFKWLNVQIDINNAYLYANLDLVIYMSQPEGFVVEADKVCRLKKAIYGLHQSG